MCVSTLVWRRGVATTGSVAMNSRSYRSRSSRFGSSLAARDQPAELVVARRRMREQRHLVSGVKLHQRTEGPAAGEEILQPAIRKHALDEVLAQPRIGQPPFFLDRQRREPAHQRRGKEADGRCARACRASLYVLTRSMPQLGESFLST